MFANAVELDPLYARAYAGIADCDSFLFLHYHFEAGIDTILATARRRWNSTTNSRKRMPREASRCHLRNDTRKQRPNSKGQLRSTQIPSRPTIFTPVPVSPRGSWNGRPRFLSGRQKTSQTIINHRAC